MEIIDLVILLVVAGVCGALGQAITGFKRGGFVVSIALGFVGALGGMWLARQFKLPDILTLKVGESHFPIVWSVIGSALFVLLVSLFSRSRAK